MHALIQVRKDDSFETLCFRTEDDAVRFQEFVLTYMRESGAGNGYGAYWILGLSIESSPRLPMHSTTDIDVRRCQSMLHDILMARTSGRTQSVHVEQEIYSADGVINFRIGDLPPRQRPKAGDRFRVVNPEATAKEREIREGHVHVDHGHTLTVYSVWDASDDGCPKPGAEFVKIRSSVVMKI